MCVADWLKGQGVEEVNLVGVGDTSCIAALFAAALSPQVARVQLVDMQMASFDEDVVGKHVKDCRLWTHRLLWITDIPELKAMLRAEGRL